MHLKLSDKINADTILESITQLSVFYTNNMRK